MIITRPLSQREAEQTDQFCRKQNCPTETSHLTVLMIPLTDISGCNFMGQLVTHTTMAAELVTIFESIRKTEYPIERMKPLSVYYGDDDMSMADNNSSCFNGRLVKGTERWSYHAFGQAVDLNPLTNPWMYAGQVYPPAGRAFMDRSQVHPAILREDSPVVRIFKAHGWEWGGDWQEQGPDYHHFQKPPRAKN
jgi:hypothetical protein